MKYGRWFTTAAFAATLAAGSAMAQAGTPQALGAEMHGANRGAAGLHGGTMGGRGMGRGSMRGSGRGILAELDLTADQRAKVASIHDRQMRKAIPIQGSLRLARLDLHQMLRADHPDQRAIEAQIDRMASIQASLHKLHLEGMLEMRELLTPEQREKLKEHGPVFGDMGGMDHGHAGFGLGPNDDRDDENGPGGSAEDGSGS